MAESRILSAKQIRALDAYTIQNEPIASVDLMERASRKLFNWISKNYLSEATFTLFCGPGNNGGDGLVLARLLLKHGYKIQCFVLEGNYSEDNLINQERLREIRPFGVIEGEEDFPKIETSHVIDALFGSGLNKPLAGVGKKLVAHINGSKKEVLSIDIASGLFADQSSTGNTIIQPTITLSLQYPKLAFLLPENESYVGDWHVLDIGLLDDGVNTSTPYFLTNSINSDRQVSKFSHKGNYGHALLIAGSYGKMGAAFLSAKACLRSGVGLLTVHVPSCGINILQTGLPEAMVSADKNEKRISELPALDDYSALGIGPGLGTGRESMQGLEKLLSEINVPLVIDADALNILSQKRELLDKLPEQTILTPHPGEFRRLAGSWDNDYQKLKLQQEFSKKHKVIVALKGAYTSVSNINGELFFNTTGNPAMATAGSGDVLTGIILSFLAQGFIPLDAAIHGVYHHGEAGDRAAINRQRLIAGDIIEELSRK